MMANRSRPVLFSEHVRGLILRSVSLGLFRGNAAEIAGIGPDTVDKWLAKGRRAFDAWLEVGDVDAPLDDWGMFYRDVLTAEANVESSMVRTIVEIATGAAEAKASDRIKAAEWWLKRKRNKRYRAADVEVEVRGGEVDPIETLAARIAARAEREREDRDPPSAFA